MRFIYIWFFSLFLVSTAYSQAYIDQFGKNRIQYKSFKWKVFTTHNFEIFYNEGDMELAQSAGRYAEEELERVIDLIGFTPYDRIRMIVYTSPQKSDQSNIGLGEDLVVVGGNTSFVKSRIEVSYKGSQVDLRREITYGITKILLNVMMYGGSLKDVVQSSYLLSLPEWYIKGLAAYVAYGNSPYMNSYAREALERKKFKVPAALTGREAEIAGHAIWNYIVEKYGLYTVPNLLNLTRIVRNEEAAIESTLGIPYSIFLAEFRGFYLGINNNLKKFYQMPQEANYLKLKSTKKNALSAVKVNAKGNRIAFVKFQDGKYKLFTVETTDMGKKVTKTIQRGGVRSAQRDFDMHNPVFAWKSDDELAYIYTKSDKTYLEIRNLKTGDKVKKKLTYFKHVFDFAFSEDGTAIVLSADKDGQTDLFLMDNARGGMKQITNDIFDDLSPSFYGSTREIIFASNRSSDTLILPKKEIYKPLDQYSLFRYNGTSRLERLTQDINVVQPVYVKSANSVLFISDDDKLDNLYSLNLKDKSVSRKTAFLFNVNTFDISATNQNLVTINRVEGKERAYFFPHYNLDSVFTQFKEGIPSDIGTTEDEKIRKSEKQEFEFNSKEKVKEKEINLDDFMFESELKDTVHQNQEAGTPLTALPADTVANKNQLQKKTSFLGPYPYRNFFGIDNVISTILIDPLRGLGILLEGQMSDILGNHRINVGAFGVADLKTNNIFGEYIYLKKRVDLKARYDRKNLFASNESTSSQVYAMNKLTFTASYPFSVYSRLSISPFAAFTRRSVTEMSTRDITKSYEGLNASFVFDNTIKLGLNMIEGTRFIISAEQYWANGSPASNFGKINLDLRRYQRIYKEIVLAARIAGGAFTGNAKKNFLLGGMDNWLFNSTDNSAPNSPLAISQFRDNSDLLFIEYAMPMRGFVYNTQFGSRYVLMNAEFRIPFRALYRQPISSSFLRNFQLVAFTDAGSAWTGDTPFSKNNSINTTVAGGKGNPFTAQVRNYVNPFLVGYGIGARTLLLGYYVKADVAWGIKNNIVQSPMFYFTFGYDF
jgi:WD40 repeat protein